ncbi:MAG: hypothetical protein IAF02_04170 [Anaerolineae bacterium]|nr:hypothetical protein [Anaerolineae bacterium]
MKDIVLKTAVYILLITALGQLAASQIHILAITKIFANQIGFYLFMFIIFGITTAFNGYLLNNKRRGLILFVGSGILAIGAGYIYMTLMQTDVAAQKTITMADVQSSWLLVAGSIAIYGIGLLVISLITLVSSKPAQI